MSKGALSLRQAETYYDEKYARDDYYTEDRTVAGEWFGIAAEALGLTGTAARADFIAILRAVDPRTGAELVAKAQGREQRRAGWDATFSAPKSVSIQALVGGDARLIAAHREAVTAALGELETYAQARRRRGQEWVTTGNFAAVRFDHLAARPSRTGSEKGYAPDPQLHTHVVIANLTQRPDGAWRSLEPLEIYRSQSWATALYRSHLAERLGELGARRRRQREAPTGNVYRPNSTDRAVCHAARADPKAGLCPTPTSRATDQNVTIGERTKEHAGLDDACTHLD
jgi:conjugative relaxase-like TrwC/TraI family protein